VSLTVRELEMPLSEQEQRLLDEMERSLYHNDADDVTTVGARRGRPNYTAVVIGVLAGVIGLGLLVVGVTIRQPVVGILGFVIMFAGALVAIAPPRRLTIPAAGQDAAPGKPRSGFMDSLNERWERRNDDNERES
jgi:hypothetical protein